MSALVDLPDRRLTDDEIAVFVPVAILSDQQNPGSNQPFEAHVGAFLARLGIDLRNQRAFQQQNPDLEQRIAEYCWRLTSLGHLVPKVSGGNWGLFHLTDKGRLFLSAVDPQALTIGGLDSKLRDMGFDDDDLVRQYARLSHDCFLAGHNESSIVMLGVASELLVRRLADALDNRHVEGVPKRHLRSSAGQDLAWLDNALRTNRRALKRSLPDEHSGDWIEPLAKLLNGTGEALRMSRNDFGHPTGVKAHQSDALELLTLFPRFAAQAKRALDQL